MESVQKAITLKKELDALRPLDSVLEQRIMQKFRLDWNYHSNHLEGNTLSYGETKALILFGITAQGKPLRDHIEITGHNEAVNWVLDVVKGDMDLTEKFIRELHSLLLKEPYQIDAITPEGKPTKKWVNIGQYKHESNHVRTQTGEIFYFASPEETSAKMFDLLAWYKKEREESTLKPILLAAKFHYEFIRIHPFDDGNGRTARILTNFILMKFGYPPVIIETEDKPNYLSVLEQADAGSLEPFIAYIAANLVHSLELMLKAAQGELFEDTDDIDKELLLLEKRLAGLSKPIEVYKSKDIIIKILQTTFQNLYDKVFGEIAKFKKFYKEFSVTLFHNGNGFEISCQDVNLVNELSNKISEATNSISIDFQFRKFNYQDFNEFSFDMTIKMEFGSSRYKIGISEYEIEKYYSQELQENELQKCIQLTNREHLDFIETKIKQLESKKPPQS